MSPLRLNYQNKAAALRERTGLLDSLLGPTDAQLLQLLSVEVGGTYTTAPISGRLFERDRLEINYGRWPLSVDYITVNRAAGTRVRCNYMSIDGFKLWSQCNWVMTQFSQMFRRSAVRTGVALIDDSLFLCGTDKQKVRSVFADQQTLACLSAQPPGWVDFAIVRPREKTRHPSNVLQLQVRLHTRVKHAGHLRQLLQFSSVMLDRLVSIGSAEPPTAVA